jgi:hypothetical protein
LGQKLGNDTFVISSINEAKKGACPVAGNDCGVDRKLEAVIKAFSYGLAYALSQPGLIGHIASCHVLSSGMQGLRFSLPSVALARAILR